MTDHLKELDAAAELGKKATKRPWHHEPSDSGDSSVGLDGYGASVYAMRDGSDDPIEVADMKYPAFKVEPQDEFDDGTRYDGSQDDNGAYLAAAANLDHAAIAAAWRAKDAALAHAHSVLNLVLHRIDWSKVNPLQVDEATVREAETVVRKALTPPPAGATT